ncbi:MAG: amidohydrolase family protein [Bacteroidetes bacterium]|nr:amidohydrolase family protein [Bacteroidota bacterium]
MCGLFSGTQKLFVHCNDAREIITAINLCKDFNMQMVLVGGADAHHLTQLLKENNIPVVITRTQALPHRQDDDINLPYKLPSILQKAGVEFAITDGGYWQMRNLPFQAGNALAYGITPQQALTSITLSPARILGISQTTGSIEPQKDATLFISSGDALDMRGNNIECAFIRGKQIDLDDVQKQLYRKYVSKYGLKE